jgi:hypothetical protein
MSSEEGPGYQQPKVSFVPERYSEFYDESEVPLTEREAKSNQKEPLSLLSSAQSSPEPMISGRRKMDSNKWINKTFIKMKNNME